MIIDAATLTGACVVALGSHFAGLMGNSAEVIDALRQAGGETHERVWPLPLVDEHKEEVEGTWSDLKNLGKGREGGALQRRGLPGRTSWTSRRPGPTWTSPGTAWSDSASPTCPKGATGFGARLIARAVEILVG